jgi:hypothetical protein
MPRTSARISQADIARFIRAARSAGADAVEVRYPCGTTFRIDLGGKRGEDPPCNEWDGVR